MKKMFALVIAGSFLFVGCGGGDPILDAANKACDCAKLTKAKDMDGAKKCQEELAPLQKAAAEKAQEDPEGALESAEEAMKIAMSCGGVKARSTGRVSATGWNTRSATASATSKSW